ncbi:MAG: carbohydrate ABC transporter, partial [Sorangium cellulosum]
MPQSLNKSRPKAETLRAQIRRQLPSYLLGAVLLAIQQTLLSYRDRLFKTGVDAAVAANESQTTRTVVIILVVVVVAAMVRILSRVTVFQAGRTAEYELRGALLARLHVLGFSFFRTMPTGDIMSRATSDLGQVRLLLGFGALNVMNTGFALVSALSVMVEVSGKLTLAALAPFPLLILATRRFGRMIFTRTHASQEAVGHLSEQVQGSLAGVRVVRAFSLEQAEQKAFDEASESYLHKALALARVRGMLVPTMGSVGAAGMLIVFWYGGHLVFNGTMTEGDFVAFWAALARLTWPIMAFGFLISVVQR